MLGSIGTIGRVATGGILGALGTSVLGKVVQAGERKLDQFLGLDTPPETVAVTEAPQNRQQTIETSTSGDVPITDRDLANLQAIGVPANLLPAVGGLARNRVIPFVKKNLPTIATGLGIGGAMLGDIYTQNGLCSSGRMSKPFSQGKDGCITVTRKQQKMLKDLVMQIGYDGASQQTGLTEGQIALLVIKSFPRRSRGITGASMKTTRRTIRQLTRYAHDLDEFCKRPTPTRRRRK